MRTTIYTGLHLGWILLMACGASAQERKIGQKPEAGTEAVASVGSPILERYNLVSVTTPQLTNDLTVSLGIQGKVVIPRGAVFRVDRLKPLKACTVAQDTYVDAFVGPRGAACVFDKDNDGRIDQVSAETVMFTSKKLSEQVPYTMVDTPAADDKDYFRQTLTFLGAAGGVLRLSYREASHDVMRPAATEELSFPIAATYPQTIAWRATKITLLGLNNDGIRYRVEVSK